MWFLCSQFNTTSTQLNVLLNFLPLGPSLPRMLTITRILDAGIELNWLPPTEPNGEVHYVIYYTPEGGTEQSNDTGSNLTHYNLTGLERNRVYTNIAVQAVNLAWGSERSGVIPQYKHMGESWHNIVICITCRRQCAYIRTYLQCSTIYIENCHLYCHPHWQVPQAPVLLHKQVRV